MFATDLLVLEVHSQGTTWLVTLSGEIDVATADRANAAVREGLGCGAETVVVDLAGVTFMGSSGVHLVLEAIRAAEDRDVRFVVLPGPPGVQRVFDLAGAAERVPFARVGGRFAA